MLTHCRQTLTTMFFYVKYHRNLYSYRNNEMSINPRLELVWWYPISQPARLTLFKLHVSTSKGEPSSNCAPCDIKFSNDVSIIKNSRNKTNATVMKSTVQTTPTSCPSRPCFSPVYSFPWYGSWASWPRGTARPAARPARTFSWRSADSCHSSSGRPPIWSHRREQREKNIV